MNPTKAAPGSVFSSTFEVLNKKKKNTITGDPQWLNPQCFPWGEEVGKLHQTSKTQHCYKNSKKTKAALRGQVHSSKTKRKNSSLPRIPFQFPQNPESGGRKASLWWLYTLREQLRSWARAPTLSEPTLWKWKKSGQGWEVVEIWVPAARPCPVKRLLKSSVTPPRTKANK